MLQQPPPRLEPGSPDYKASIPVCRQKEDLPVWSMTPTHLEQNHCHEGSFVGVIDGGGHSLVRRFASPNIGLGLGLGLG